MPKGRKGRFPREEIPRTKEPFSEKEKRPVTKEISTKIEEIRANSTNLKLESKKTHSDCAKKPDSNCSYGLKVKNNTISVLLDSGSSGDLLFIKKGSSKCISVAKRVVPQS